MGTMFDIRGAGGGSGSGEQHTPVESPDSLHSIAYAHIIDIISEGPCVGWADSAHPMRCMYYNETAVENSDGSLNFHDITVDGRIGTMTQSPMKGFDGVQNEVSVGVELTYATEWVQEITNTDITSLRVLLSTPTLAETVSSGDNSGDTHGYNVSYEIWLKTDAGAFVKIHSSAFNGKATTKYQRSHHITLPNATTSWTIKVKRTTPDNSSSYVQDTTFVDSYTEIVDVRMRMPMTAYVGSVLDAKNFNSIPSRAFHWKGKLLKVPVNYDPVARTYTGVWNGTFKTAYSNNPAWVFYDMVTNDRYGLGHLVTAAMIDKWSLYTIAQYCDELVPDGFGGTEPRFTANVYLQTQNDALKVLQDLATVFRGVMYAIGNSIYANCDMPSDPIYTYTPANVIGGKFQYTGSAKKVRHTVALVSWNDMGDFGRAKVEYVEDPEGIIRYGVQQTEVVAIGCTSRGQAHRLGKYILATGRYETDMLSFSVGLDGALIPAPGKVVKIADPVRAGRRMAGRIRSATINSITVDKMPTGLVVGDTVTIILPTGLPEQRVVQSFDAVAQTIVVTANFSAIPVGQSVWLVEQTTLYAQTFRVVSVTEAAEGNVYAVNAIQHEPDKYDFVDFNTKIDEAPISKTIPKTLMAPGGIAVSKVDVSETNAAHKIVTVSWNQVLGASAYHFHWRQNRGPWHDLGKISTHAVRLQNLLTGPLDVMIEAIGAGGVRSQPSFAGPFDVTSLAQPPGFVSSLSTDIATALTTGQNAQATADGKITSFYQSTPPVVGSGAGQAKVGDIWFDTDDHNATYRVVGTAWVLTKDDEIAAALAAAATAQATADGKVVTYFQSGAPTTHNLGDLWFDTDAKKLYRWSGSAWDQNIGDITKDQIAGSGVNILWDEYANPNSQTVALAESGGPQGVLSYDTVTKVGTTGGSLKYAINDPAGNAALVVRFGESSTDYNLPLKAGAKYLVSAYLATDNAAASFLAQIKNSNGSFYGAGNQTIGSTGTFVRMTWAVDASANMYENGLLHIYPNRTGITTPYNVWIDRVQVEEMKGNLVDPSSWQPGPAGRQALVAIANAATAQATADGKITSFYQATPPVIGSLSTQAKNGDVWFDTDDGNKIYTVVSGAWVATPDSRIAQAISDAAGAQATADGKVTTYYQTTQPGSASNGDLWYNKATGLLQRWNATAGVWEGAELANVGGENLLANSSFISNNTNCPMGAPIPQGDGVCDGWHVQQTYSSATYTNTDVSLNAGNIRMRCYASTPIPAGAVIELLVGANKVIDCQEGKTYEFGIITTSAGNGTVSVPATIDIRQRINVRWYDASGSLILYQQAAAIQARGGGTVFGTLVAPAGTRQAIVWLSLYIKNMTASSWGISANGGGSILVDTHFNYAWMRKIDELRVAGSGQRIGDQRNLPQSLTTNYGSVRTATALSATSAGVISVNAFTYRYGSCSVAYSAVTSAITGKAQGSSWVIYCVDPDYSGGVQTWLAAANEATAMNLGDGVVVAGVVTIPTSGTSSGGGGGSGGAGGYCVDWDTMLPDGRYVRDLVPGDLVECVDIGIGDFSGPYVAKVNRIDFGEEECYRLVTEKLHAVVQSASTPMDLRDGRQVKTPQMQGQYVLVNYGNKLEWQVVSDLQRVGVRKVVKVDLGNRMFFAGETPYVTIATHNLKN